MRRFPFLFSALLSVCFLGSLTSSATAANAVTRHTDGISLDWQQGQLFLKPVSDNAVRVIYSETGQQERPEWVLVTTTYSPPFKVKQNRRKATLSLKAMKVVVNLETGQLLFYDQRGRLILSEKPGTRVFKPTTLQGEPCAFVEQTFVSPADEHLFGLGQFQDGHLNLRTISRRLTQVNSQIAIPFLLSSKGYGLLWHQYGLTDYNPADESIPLIKRQKAAENEQLADVTTTAGTRRVAQNQAVYDGRFSVPADGTYTLFLDLGGMGNRHYVAVDGQVIIDQSNMWLPPAVSQPVALKAGEHTVEVLCKADNTPTLSWRQPADHITFRSPHAERLDYVVFAGSADEVIGTYRYVSGDAPLFPKWAYGFWQCRERYTSAKHLVETAKLFREKKLPMDVIVQDWQYWGQNGWGVPQFDARNYPDPEAFIEELHDLNVHFNISIWSNPDQNSTIGKTYVANKRFIPGTKWLDYFNPATRQDYWKTLNTNMFEKGVDSWWMDAVEPENDALHGVTTHLGPGDFYRSTYPLLVSQAVYEGQRSVTEAKRVCILTRSAFSGQQRYGVINWSGDVGSDWDTYRRQVVAGLNFTASGLPYWTTDIGGFFRPGGSQYTDPNYHDILTRWFQWGTFNPIFRMHGYQSETEPWKYGETVENNLRTMLNLRYRLMPYIYSEAWQITSMGSTMMRPLVMDFSQDPKALEQAYEYMFGPAFLVAPVVEPGVKRWPVYLPAGHKWYDFQTGLTCQGGTTVMTDAPQDVIPLYVKAGSIVPMGPVMQHTGENTSGKLDIHVYAGANATFTLYEDEGDAYQYEQGIYATIPFTWNDKKQTLTIGAREGSYPGMRVERELTIVLHACTSEGAEQVVITQEKPLRYTGSAVTMAFKP
ncbi:MAG: DUF5110 domain-containing protein [Bacteroidales bacterium]|nr:DUF5110 domain-containing protein [Bacteroidales bacterium]